jgi:hypothetical protein
VFDKPNPYGTNLNGVPTSCTDKTLVPQGQVAVLGLSGRAHHSVYAVNNYTVKRFRFTAECQKSSLRIHATDRNASKSLRDDTMDYTTLKLKLGNVSPEGSGTEPVPHSVLIAREGTGIFSIRHLCTPFFIKAM